MRHVSIYPLLVILNPPSPSVSNYPLLSYLIRTSPNFPPLNIFGKGDQETHQTYLQHLYCLFLEGLSILFSSKILVLITSIKLFSLAPLLARQTANIHSTSIQLRTTYSFFSSWAISILTPESFYKLCTGVDILAYAHTLVAGSKIGLQAHSGRKMEPYY